MRAIAAVVFTSVALAATTTVNAAQSRVFELSLSLEEIRKPIRIDCPAGQPTRLVLPGILVRVKVSPGADEGFAIEKIASAPLGVFRLSPKEHPLRGTLEASVKGGQSFVFDLRTLDRGMAKEIRIRLVDPNAAPAPTATPAVVRTAPPTLAPVLPAPVPPTVAPTAAPEISTPSPTRAPATVAPPTSAPTARPTPVPPTPAPTAVPTAAATPPTSAAAPEDKRPEGEEFAWKELGLAGRPINLNEVQGVPGQRPMVLAYAQEGPVHVWFRFRVRGGADLEVKLVEGPAGPLAKSHYVSEVEKKDLLLFVQLPKELWKKKGGMRITLSNDVPYKFRLRNAGLLRVLGDVTDAVNPF